MTASTLRALLLATAALSLAACVPPNASRPAPVETATAAPVADPQLLEDVRLLSADDMEGRDTGSAGGAKARAYIVSRLDALGVAPASFGRLQPFQAQGHTREGTRTFDGVNIIGLIPGARVADRYIVVTAHYDHVGVNDGQIYNGADDNASGVATLLALGLLVWTSQIRAGIDAPPSSPRLQQLVAAVAAGDRAATGNFWRSVDESRAPLIEQPEGAD